LLRPVAAEKANPLGTDVSDEQPAIYAIGRGPKKNRRLNRDCVFAPSFIAFDASAPRPLCAYWCAIGVLVQNDAIL
jgi:hypothetical protein